MFSVPWICSLMTFNLREAAGLERDEGMNDSETDTISPLKVTHRFPMNYCTYVVLKHYHVLYSAVIIPLDKPTWCYCRHQNKSRGSAAFVKCLCWVFRDVLIYYVTLFWRELLQICSKCSLNFAAHLFCCVVMDWANEKRSNKISILLCSCHTLISRDNIRTIFTI